MLLSERVYKQPGHFLCLCVLNLSVLLLDELTDSPPVQSDSLPDVLSES